MKQKFEFGQQVRVLRNVRNDGTFPGRETGELLLRRGSTGYVRDVGSFLQDQVIYSVDFIKYGYRVGCREEELADAEDVWVENKYEFRDTVTLRSSLSLKGEVVAEAGSQGEIAKVIRDGAAPIRYHLRIGERYFLVPETSLFGESELEERCNEAAKKDLTSTGPMTNTTLPWQPK